MWWFRHHSRRILRLWMKPIDPDVARTWERRLKFGYIFIGWNALVATVYLAKKRHEKRTELGLIEDTTAGHRKARAFGYDNAKIIRFSTSGLQTYDYNRTKYMAEHTKRQEEAIKKKLEQNPDLMKDISKEELEKAIKGSKTFDLLF